MKTLTALAIKFIASFIALFVILGLIYGMSIQSVILITAVIGVISYIIGDKLLLPRTNNVVATSVDFGLSFLIIWSIVSYGNLDNYRTLFWASIVGGLGVALCEYFFHIYLYRRFYPQEKTSKRRISVMNYAMESSEEITPIKKEKNDN
ncbi:YndM family protein [Heyndrickxia vini]|uniref:YndM family protein n=1 Tax=Heyndrickxia vini TaxID=1476025 RepID=A0ABX7E760_9BACI|nr:YndM family protein [Heyndrickxia vini]QQZ11134.1 YndM family protein [Heyndrickxia vini]